MIFNTYRKALVIFYLVFCLFSIVSAKYSGGDGSEENPYQIANPNDLLALAADTNDYNDCFILINDINIYSLTFTTAVIARDTNPASGGFDGAPFTGIFDGNGHSIFNLKIDTNEISNRFLGLFGKIGQGGIVKNLGVEAVNIIDIIGDSYASDYVGSLCGYNYYGTISNCHSTGLVSGDYYEVGGGYVEKITMALSRTVSRPLQ